MATPTRKTTADDPTLDTGNVDETVLPCERNDVEVVSDLDEPNTIEFESGPEDEEPVSIVFKAIAQDSGGGGVQLSGPEPEHEQPLANAAQEPEEHQAEETFVEIVLVDGDGEPVANAEYRIELPDSSIAEGVLDDQGKARIEHISPGQCVVTFPSFDAREWHPA